MRGMHMTMRRATARTPILTGLSESLTDSVWGEAGVKAYRDFMRSRGLWPFRASESVEPVAFYHKQISGFVPMKSAAIFLTLLLSSVLQAQQTLDTKIATLPASLVAKTRSFNPNYLVHSPQDIKKPAKLPLDVKLTVFPELGHGIAKATYTDAAFYEWLFKWRNDARPIDD